MVAKQLISRRPLRACSSDTSMLNWLLVATKRCRVVLPPGFSEPVRSLVCRRNLRCGERWCGFLQKWYREKCCVKSLLHRECFMEYYMLRTRSICLCAIDISSWLWSIQECFSWEFVIRFSGSQRAKVQFIHHLRSFFFRSFEMTKMSNRLNAKAHTPPNFDIFILEIKRGTTQAPIE